MKNSFIEIHDQLIENIKQYSANGNYELIDKAFWFGFEAHQDQTRRSGEPYFTHCINAAEILVELRMDETTIAACLLHDVVEDTGVTFEDVEEQFGIEIAHLVDGVTKISELVFKKSENEQAENFRKLVLSMATDFRVIMIKFADRLHNMRTLQYLSQKRQIRIAQETLDIYAPLAYRFGIASFGRQYEDLCLKYLDPQAYRNLDEKISEKWQERIKHIEKMEGPIKEEMNKLGIPCTILGRPKSYYSVYRKMKVQEIPFEEVYDLLAMRIIVDRKEGCYAAVGVVHTLFTPVQERFKDYIATPKSNGYQSIHTTIMGPSGRMIEVQLRTRAMDYTADLGIAAHWLYKSEHSDEDLDKQLVWVKQFVDWESEDSDPNEFMKSFRYNLIQNEIFVFTPKGRLINLPEKATPVDFAFAVHSEVGLHCIGAKVNSKVVPLNTSLENGDEVEILTSSNPNPQEYWISFLITARARTQIRKWLNDNRKVQHEELGKEMLSKELEKYELSFDDMTEEIASTKSGYSGLRMVLGAVGRQEIQAEEIVKRLFPKAFKKEKRSFLQRIPNILRKHDKEKPIIDIHGDYPLVIELSECCMPIPGDKIIGFLDEEKNVKVHRVKCKSIPKIISSENYNVNVNWSESNGNVFPTCIQISGKDRKHFLRDMASEISKSEINITGMHIEVQGMIAICDVKLDVENIEQLNQVMDKLSKVKGINKVKRI
ncbi:MAG: bifunctional (p)ppGpp synthetase/guanosine-3',5'-bis(diphosphate) 3'-pyrophosphohydrolase [bacterium]|nr:bifunctional (p)ppGpp synthetase/guanosine-3',5'-bis(diphosphate) 3'-pyrophosphohydrolase [bacterium]